MKFKTLFEVLDDTVKNPAADNPDVTPEIAELVEHMMKVEPAERMQTMSDVRDRVRALLA